MEGWITKKLEDVVDLKRGFDLPTHSRRPGPYPVLSSGVTAGWHDEGPIKGPGLVIGRATNLGQPSWSQGDFWPLNTTLYAANFFGNEPRWVFHLFESMDLTGFDSGSVQPMLNRNYIAQLPILVPPIREQRAIAEVLGALDDKIAANTKLAETSMELAGEIYRHGVTSFPEKPMNEVLSPILGGTPARARDDFWGGSALWASAKDVTGANIGVITDTEEKITELACAQTKAKPLPSGSVILTARGTVGAVARLAVPASFNQSCYGFVPGALPPGMLYFGVLNAANRAKTIAHGSVFDTITMKTFAHLRLPDMTADQIAHLESLVSPQLDVAAEAVRENTTLDATRGALLPQLMSGKLRIGDI